MRISDLLGEPDKRKPNTDDQVVDEASPAPPTPTGAAAAMAAAAEAADAASASDGGGESTGAVEVPKAPDADRVSFGSALGSSEQRARAGVQVGEAAESTDGPAGLNAPDDDLLPDRGRKR